MARKRQDALHETMTGEIKRAARKLMAEYGTAGLSIRAIAREMDITAPGIYHYFGSLDDIITALITDAFNALADAIEAARDALPESDTVGRLTAVLLAYRGWAHEHPVDFQLIYGSPIPGYHAPREVTVPAVIRGFVVIVGLIAQLYEQGLAEIPPEYQRIPESVRRRLREIAERDNYPVSEAVLNIGILGWTRLHGIIMLELFNHLPPVVGDVDAFYRAELRHIMIDFGVKEELPL
jgi:AcrR family transcriptional regulator